MRGYSAATSSNEYPANTTATLGPAPRLAAALRASTSPSTLIAAGGALNFVLAAQSERDRNCGSGTIPTRYGPNTPRSSFTVGLIPAKAWTGISIHSAPSLGNSSRNTSSPRPSSAATNDARPSSDSQTRPSRVSADTTAWSSQARSWTRGIDALRVQRTFATSWYPSRSAFASGDFVPPALWALSRAAATAGWDVSTVWKSTTRRRPRHPMGPARVPAEKRVSANRRGAFLRSRGSDVTQFSAGRPTSLYRPVCSSGGASPVRPP